MAGPNVSLILPDGSVREFKPEDAAFHVQHQGWLPATPENLVKAKSSQDAGGFVGGVEAGLEGLARGASAGFSDALEKKLGVSAEGIMARREAHPVVGTVGELAGGGGLAAGTTALAASTFGLGPMAAAVAGGALAGGLSGAGQQVSQAELTNKPLAAEQLVQHVIGEGVIGGVFGGIGGLIGKGIQKLGGAAARLPGFAEEQAVRSLGATPTQFADLAKKSQVHPLGRFALDEGLLQGGAEKGVANAEALTKEFGGKIGALVAEADQAGIAGPSPKSLARDLKDLLPKKTLEKIVPEQGPGSAPDWLESTSFATPPEAEAIRVDRSANKFNRPGTATLKEYIADLSTRKTLTIGEAQSLKNAFSGAIKDSTGESSQLYREARAVFARHIDEAIDTAGKELNVEDFKALRGQYGSAKDAQRLLERQVGRDLAKPSWQAVTAALNPFNAPQSIARGVARSGLVAQGADYLSTTRVVQGLVNQADAQWDRGLASLLGKGAQEVAMPSVADYARIAQGVSLAAQDPQALVQRTHVALGDDLVAHHPEVADMAGMTAQTAVKFLQDNLPKSRHPASMFDSGWQPPDYLKAKWLDMYRAVANPASVAANPTVESLNALRMVYPDTYQAITSKLRAKLTTDKGLTYAQKLQISKLLGPTTSTLTDPGFVATMQSTFQAQSQQQPQGQQQSARTQAAKHMKFKQVAQDETTSFNKMQEQ